MLRRIFPRADTRFARRLQPKHRARLSIEPRMRQLVLLTLVACGSSTIAPTPGPAPAPPQLATADAPAAEPEPPRVPPQRIRAPDWGSKRIEHSDEVCAVADNNLLRAEDAILAWQAATPGPARAAWNHRTRPVRLDLIQRRFGLDATEKARLDKIGFAVLDRLEQPSYGWAYHDIYQSQLPVFVTVDSILNAVYASHDGIVKKLEIEQLAPQLAAMLDAMHRALPAAAAKYPVDTARDLDLYLTVARSLLADKPAKSALGDVDREAAAVVAQGKAAQELAMVTMFGRQRIIDFTQLAPRGHYADEELQPYFRAAMWLSRLEFNLVSRSSRSSAPGLSPDPRETPREDVDALALADLVAAAHQTAALAHFDDVFGWLAGRREDLSVPDLAKLAAAAGITDLRAPDAADKLRAAIGNRFQRTARIHYMPEGSPILPAIATLLGPRIVPDTAAARPLAHSETPERDAVRGGDIAYLLGNDHGKDLLKDDLARFPDLADNLERARKILADAPRTDDLYTAWLDALRALAQKPAGSVPSFMDTPAFADFRVATTVVGYAQLRHNHVLVAGQPYGEGGCAIPDGYVEPAPAVYDAIARYADLGAAKLPPDKRDYFTRLGKIARVLSAISKLELANRPLPTEALQFLGMVVEIRPFGSDGRPTYTGWYFDLFDDRGDAIAHPDLIADYFTSPRSRTVDYLGVGAPRMALFVVDTGGGPRAMIGPVARGYEYIGPLARRVDDAAARKLAAADRKRPWEASYAVAAPPEPSIRVEGIGDYQYSVEAKRALGKVTLEGLDHHRLPLVSQTRDVGPGKTLFRLQPKQKGPDGDEVYVEMIHIKVGKWDGWGELQCMDGCTPIEFGELRTPPPPDEPD
jgi:hypothetical protein